MAARDRLPVATVQIRHQREPEITMAMAEVEGLGEFRKEKLGWKLALGERRHLIEPLGRGYNSESQMALIRPVWPSVATPRRTSHKILGLRAEATVKNPTGAWEV